MSSAGERAQAPADHSVARTWTAFAASLAVFLIGHSLFLGLAVALAGAP